MRLTMKQSSHAVAESWGASAMESLRVTRIFRIHDPRALTDSLHDWWPDCWQVEWHSDCVQVAQEADQLVDGFEEYREYHD